MTSIKTIHEQQSNYTLDEVARIHDVTPWTIRLWIDRFDYILKPQRNEKGDIVFTSEEVKCIGLIHS